MKMPPSVSLRTAAPLLCHALLVGLVIETRLEVSEWRVAAGAGRHRELKDDVLQPSSLYATADDLEDLRVSLEAQLAQQAVVISSVKADAVELMQRLLRSLLWLRQFVLMLIGGVCAKRHHGLFNEAWQLLEEDIVINYN